jgi:uncharacterized membrane protein YjjP (DUF1212 family)
MFFWIYTILGKLASDTLKKEGKWSTTLLTMFTAWMAVLVTYLIDFAKNDFKLNETAFGIMVVIALGSKITNSFSNKIDAKTDQINDITDGKA